MDLSYFEFVFSGFKDSQMRLARLNKLRIRSKQLQPGFRKTENGLNSSFERARSPSCVRCNEVASLVFPPDR